MNEWTTEHYLLVHDHEPYIILLTSTRNRRFILIYPIRVRLAWANGILVNTLGNGLLIEKSIAWAAVPQQ